MPIVRQLRESYPWIADSLTAMVAGATGISALIPFAPFAPGALSAPREHSWEHPLRVSRLRTLARSPGSHFRELQRQLDAANGTLRHHLRVLVNERSVPSVPVTGRTCDYAGAPAQVAIREGTGVTDQATAAAMLPVGLSDVQRKIVTMLSNSPNPPSQAQLARDMGKSRTTVNSALGILRKRGIVSQGTLCLAPHLDGLGTVSYTHLTLPTKRIV